MSARAVWLTGATGLLGGWVREALERGGHMVRCERVDLEDARAIERAFGAWAPGAVIHCAAVSAIADCARDPDRARRVNVEATAAIARGCAAIGARLVHVSTDLVFDGEHAPYAEDAPRAPGTVYGRTKAEAEEAAREAGDVVIARLALLFGPTRTTRRGFFDAQLEALRAGRPITLFDDEWRTPLSLRAASEVLVRLASGAHDTRGIVHVAGPERMTRLEMGERLARVIGATPSIRAASRTTVPGEPRARDLSMDTAKLRALFGEPSRSFEEECRAMLAP